MKSIQERFGIAVRLRREEIEISQEAMAEASGIHRTYASSIERGRVTVSIEVAEKLAMALKISLPDLFTLTERAKRG